MRGQGQDGDGVAGQSSFPGTKELEVIAKAQLWEGCVGEQMLAVVIGGLCRQGCTVT